MKKILFAILSIASSAALLAMEGGEKENNDRFKKLEMQLDRLAEKSEDDLIHEAILVEKEKDRLQQELGPESLDFETVWANTVEEKGYLDLFSLKRNTILLLNYYQKSLQKTVNEEKRKALEEKINKLNDYLATIKTVENELVKFERLKEPIEQ